MEVDIPPVDEAARAEAQERQRRLTKPPGSLGRLETLAAEIAGLTGDPTPALEEAAIATVAADHGVAAEGVSAFPQAVTAQMVANFAADGAAVNALAGTVDARNLIVDLGVAGEYPDGAGVIEKAVAEGTDNIAAGTAMSRAQAREAVGFRERSQDREVVVVAEEVDRGGGVGVLPVRLVDDDEGVLGDGVGQLDDRLTGELGAGRVVRRREIDHPFAVVGVEDGVGRLCEVVGLPERIGRHVAVVVLGAHAVVREAGFGREDTVTGVEEGPREVVDGAVGAGRHPHLLGRHAPAVGEFLAEVGV